MDTPDDFTPAEDETPATGAAVDDATLPEDVAGEEPLAPAGPAGPGVGRLLLAVLVSLVVAAGGIAAWAGVYAVREREYIGVAVIIGLLVGYVMRAVSGRATLVPRLLAGLVTAAACAVGSYVGQIAYVAHRYHFAFWHLLRTDLDHFWTVLHKRNTLSWVVFAAAVVIAFLAAGPPKPKKPKTTEAPEATGETEPTESTEPAEPAELADADEAELGGEG